MAGMHGQEAEEDMDQTRGSIDRGNAGHPEGVLVRRGGQRS